MMQRFTLSISEEMAKALERERKKRMLDSVPETARVIISEYLTAQEKAE
jgi:metal-responsive CopG/Arc/MetJ family transcriptional regulator